MGIKATDLYIQTALELALEDIRKNEFLIRDMLEDVLCDPMLNQKYGEKEVNKMSVFLKQKIAVGIEYRLDMASMPAIAISINGGSEIAGSTGVPLSDGYDVKTVTADKLGGAAQVKQAVYGPLCAESYDKASGKLILPESLDLFDDMYVYDVINKKDYPIQLIVSGVEFYLEAGSNPDLNNFEIRSPRMKYIHTKRHSFFNEEIKITCMATDGVETIYLYMLVMYILGRYKLNLFETRNFRVSTIRYSPIYKTFGDDNSNNIYQRDIIISGQVTHSYIESTKNMVMGSHGELLIDKMPETPSALQAQAQEQIWMSPKDLKSLVKSNKTK
jgi:hypothetical protein